MKNFSVTFERWTHEDVEAGETDSRGFVIEDVSLGDAIRLGLEYSNPKWSGSWEPSDSRVASARWFTFYDWNEGTRERYQTGIVEQRSLHIPDNVTGSSRARIARLFS